MVVNLDCNHLIFIILTTEANKKNACKIANLLLEDKLVACVSFYNVESHFCWKGGINQSKEVQLIIKCAEDNLNKVCQKIAEFHSYELPEIIYFPVSASKEYIHWVNSF